MRTIDEIRDALKGFSHKKLQTISGEIGVNFHTLISIRYATRKRNCYEIIQKINSWLDKNEEIQK